MRLKKKRRKQDKKKCHQALTLETPVCPESKWNGGGVVTSCYYGNDKVLIRTCDLQLLIVIQNEPTPSWPIRIKNSTFPSGRLERMESGSAGPEGRARWRAVYKIKNNRTTGKKTRPSRPHASFFAAGLKPLYNDDLQNAHNVPIVIRDLLERLLNCITLNSIVLCNLMIFIDAVEAPLEPEPLIALQLGVRASGREKPLSSCTAVKRTAGSCICVCVYRRL